MIRSTLIVALLAFSASATAQDLNYTFINATYGNVDFDDSILDVDGSGFGLAGSVGFTDNFHAFAEYQTAAMDFDVDLNILEAGIGYNHGLSDTVDIIGRLSYVDVEASAPGVPSDSEDGYAAGVGIRAALTQMVELNGGVDYVDFSESGSETRINAGIQLNFTESISAGLKGVFWDDVTVLQLNARFYFQ